MKRKFAKTLDNIRNANGGTAWSDVEELMVRHFGGVVEERTGSGIAIVFDDQSMFYADRPHPRRECGNGLIKRVRAFLREHGRL